MKTILVSGASGVIGYGTLKALRAAKRDYKLIGTTIYDDSVAPAFCDVFEQAPHTVSAGYLDWLKGVIAKHHIDMIIPCINIDMETWNEHRDELSQTGTFVLLNNPELVDLSIDKWKFYDSLRETVVAPYLIESRLEGTFAQLRDAFGLPFLLKPRRGFGARGMVRVNSEEIFTQHQQDLGPIHLAQPIVGDDDSEYTVSAFFDSDSEMRCFMGMQRKLAAEGFTEKARVMDVPGAEAAMRAFAALLKPVGPTNFQFRMHNEQLKLLEINPRISSATAIRTAFGYNEALMSVEYFLNGIMPAQPKIRRGYAVRYAEEHIFYDRDTV